MTSKNTIRTKDFPNLRRMHQELGPKKIGEMWSLSPSTISGMINHGEVRPIYEMLAKTYYNEGKGKMIVVRCKPEMSKMILGVLDSLDVEYMDLDL